MVISERLIGYCLLGGWLISLWLLNREFAGIEGDGESCQETKEDNRKIRAER